MRRHTVIQSRHTNDSSMTRLVGVGGMTPHSIKRLHEIGPGSEGQSVK